MFLRQFREHAAQARAATEMLRIRHDPSLHAEDSGRTSGSKQGWSRPSSGLFV